MGYKLIATAQTPMEIADALNARRKELQLTMLELDEILGFAGRYSSKIFAHGYRKNLGHLSLPAMLDALGCRLAIIANEADDALPPITRRTMHEKSISAGRVETVRRHHGPAT
jgi:hypothetical protein